MIKKIFLSMLLMLVCIPVFAANESTFYYDSERVEEMWINKVSSKETRSAHPYLLKRRGDNIYVYCLEAFTLMQNDSKYTYDTNYLKYGLSKSDMDRINLLIYYGYGYKNHTSNKWYGITQYLIWKLTDKDADIYFSKEKNGSKANLYESEINEIESLVKEHNTKPNFIKNYTISTNSNLVIDSNIDLSNYTIESNARNVVKNNKIYFSNLDVGNYWVKLKRNDNRFKNSYMLYYSNESQNVIIPGNYETFDKEYSFNIKVEEGTLNLTKKDEDDNYLSNATYEVYNENILVDKLITDSNGKASVNLPYGKYKLKEVEAPKGYELDSNVYEFEINSSNLNIEYNLTDSKIYVEFNIKKKDSENGSFLSGAKYGIYKDYKLIEELVTDSNGYATTKLSYGNYILKEIEPPNGYELDTEQYNVVIDSSKSNFELELNDMKIYVDVSISKRSSYNNKYLENAVYGIYQDEKLIRKVVTSNSNIDIKLPYGEYEIKELLAPPGYKLDNKLYKLSINSKKNYELKFVDDKIIVKVPDTGVKKNNIAYISIPLGLIGLLYGKKKYNMH